jgi:hypothetical protein
MPDVALGVPQGAPISPLLATIGLEDDYFERNVSDSKGLIHYSDDLLFYSNNDSDLFLDQPEVGIVHAPEKSH